MKQLDHSFVCHDSILRFYVHLKVKFKLFLCHVILIYVDYNTYKVVSKASGDERTFYYIVQQNLCDYN